MRIRRVDIENFRGIKKLSDHPKDQAFVAVFRSGRQHKTTILEAMYLAVCERYSLSLVRRRYFYDANARSPSRFV